MKPYSHNKGIMIKFDKKRVNAFLDYYENGYSEIPGEAFVKAGFVDSLQDMEAAYLFKELMRRPEVSKFIDKFNEKRRKKRRCEMTLEERRQHLSNVIDDCSLYQLDRYGKVITKDPKYMVLAIRELNAMTPELNPDRDAPHTVIQLNLGNLDEQTLEQLDLLVK